jgi:dextranase
VVDLAEAFDSIISAARAELPDAVLVFNNVNDFPVWTTTRSPQDVSYTEVWQPHDTLADLAAVATRSRSLAPDRPAVLAAYQSVYASHPAEAADAATRLTMATLFSHGATQVLAGEAGNVLVDPYYVRNHAAGPATLTMLARWYDLLVAAGELLFAAGSAEITRSVAGALNGEIDVAADGVSVTHEPRAGAVWRRVVQTPLGTVVHLINLTGQVETGWDTPKSPIRPVTGLRLTLRQTGREVARVDTADPDLTASFTPVAVRAEAGNLYATLPPLRAWQLILIRHPSAGHQSTVEEAR